MEGENVRVVRPAWLWPFPAGELRESLRGAERVIFVEQNYTGQLARLARMEAGVEPDGLVLKYDGRPMTPGFVRRGLEEVLGRWT
ncbi:MAG: hypothetical protein DRO06_00810 [Thermoproteota archaeon]|nr:MAG: hypothetical protein DRO06_00810 [Candidatus Korarchaeota archaeon]